MTAVRLAGALLVALLLSGCGSRPAALHLVNYDQPGVRLVSGSDVLLEVACGSTGEVALNGRAPWTLDVRAQDGHDLGSVTINRSLPAALVVEGGSVQLTDWPVVYGPAPPSPNPCAT